jgi:hypothetical protein
MRVLHLLTALALSCGAVACFEDPVPSDGDAGDAETGDGDTGDGDGDTGDGDGDAGDGDGDAGDGDGDPGENVVVDLFTEACGLTATWTSMALGLEPVPIPCDTMGMVTDGWMVRYVELMVGDVDLTKVISLVTGPTGGSQIRGKYNLDDVNQPDTLEFRAEVLLVCREADVDCTARFALAVAEDSPNGLFAEIEDRNLSSGMQSIAMTVSLFQLLTLSEPSIVLLAERTEPALEPSPEVLIVNPRLVLP